MTITLILVVLALLALLLLLRIAKGRASDSISIANLASSLRRVDIEAFRNLIDPAEERFLKANLSSGEFRRIQRERLRAAIEYISCAAANAAVLIRLGEAARRSPDAAIAEAGDKLVDNAIRLRLYAFQSVARLYVGFILPGAHLAPESLAESYEHMTGLVRSLGRLQYQAKETPASA